VRFSQPRSVKAANLNLAPMIDTMFLLVLFVFLSAKFEPEGGLSVNLPTGKSQETPQTPDVLDLVVMRNGEIFLQKERVRIDELGERLQSYRRRGGDPILVINADKDVPYQQIVVVMDCAKFAGQSKINLKIKP